MQPLLAPSQAFLLTVLSCFFLYAGTWSVQFDHRFTPTSISSLVASYLHCLGIAIQTRFILFLLSSISHLLPSSLTSSRYRRLGCCIQLHPLYTHFHISSLLRVSRLRTTRTLYAFIRFRQHNISFGLPWMRRYGSACLYLPVHLVLRSHVPWYELRVRTQKARVPHLSLSYYWGSHR